MNRPSNKLFVPLITIMLAASVLFAQTTGHGGIDLANLDKSVNPCNDFYQFANGGWLAKNPIPAAYPAWGVGNVLDEQNQNTVRQIVEAAAKNASATKGSNEQKVGDYYASCMAEDKIEAAGLTPLASEFALIDKIKDQRDLQAEIAHLSDIGMNVPFGSGSNQDFKNASEVIFGVSQAGLGLPDRDYYFDEKRQPIRDAYVKHVANMFTLLGDAPERAATEAQTVMTLETKLAKASMTRVEQRDPANIYHRMSVADLQKLTPNFDWSAFFHGIGYTQKADVNVAEPEFFKAVNTELTATPIDDWKTYMRWQRINSAASALSKKFVDEDFNFKGRVLTGATEQQPRWKRCVRSTDGALGEALGQVYVEKAFPPAAKARALELVRNLEAALKTDIGTISWMSDPTRTQAVAKLEAYMNKIGYPDKWRDYSTLSLDRDSFFTNRMRANHFEQLRDLAKIGKAVDKAEWGMTPPTVNAYYNPQFNEIVFPAGILQPPFFDPAADDAVNYGAIGSVIGHEMTHGFDDEGAQFDAQGNLKNWFAPADLTSFHDRTNCVVTQFSGFQVEPGLNENGKLVVGESVADLGGLVIAYTAWQNSLKGKPKPVTIDGYTPEQRFFLAYAHGWATSIRPELARLLTNVDPHPLPKFRVNGPLSNMPQFSAAFQCKSGDQMVRADKDRCVIW
ncbi:MAG: putative endopeptidase [Acidobacteriota bacterium]|nr:putative endopeptidase [Acidobacteriota bacterium]